MSESILVKTLKRIVSERGKDVLQDETQVVNLFFDYCPQGKKEKALLKSAYEHGAMQELIKASKERSDVSVHINKAIYIMREQAFMDESIATSLIYDIAELLKLRNVAPQAKPSVNPQHSPENSTSQVQPSQPQKIVKTYFHRLTDENHKWIVLPIFIILTSILMYIYIGNMRQIDAFLKVFQNCLIEWLIYIVWYIFIMIAFDRSKKDTFWKNCWSFLVITGPVAMLILGTIFTDKGFWLSLIITAIRLLIPAVVGFIVGGLVSDFDVWDTLMKSLSRTNNSKKIGYVLYAVMIVLLVMLLILSLV